MEIPLSYTLTDKNNRPTADGRADVRLQEESLSVLPKFAQPLYFSLRDITDISEDDYSIDISLTSDEKLSLSQLGYKHDDFLRILYRMRNEMLLKDMLMNESVKKSGIKADFTFTGNSKEISGRGELRLYDSAFVLIPEKGQLLRIPYCDLQQIKEKDYRLVLNTEDGEKISLSKLGKHFDSFTSALSEVINELSLKVQSTIKELVPDADPLTVRKVSLLMREGKAARRSDIESLCPRLWEEMEKRVKELETGQEYEFLQQLAVKDKICIGLKRGLMGDLTGEYIWFLMPIYGTNGKNPGNLVAMEAVSDENGGGKATYFFRILSRKEYPGFRDIDRLNREADKFISRINRCMLAVNFRRQPVYLPDERLKEPRYIRYRAAVSLLPELRELRSLFVGRVIHRSIEQWKADVKSLMEFNVKSKKDSEKWKRKKGGNSDAGI